jgi:hypothetical protein
LGALGREGERGAKEGGVVAVAAVEFFGRAEAIGSDVAGKGGHFVADEVEERFEGGFEAEVAAGLAFEEAIEGGGAVDAAAAQAELNREILVVCMIETPEAVANADAIAAVPGVDVLMFGTSDLTATMGIPGQIGHPDVRKAYEVVGAACAKHGKFMGMGGVYDEKVAPDYIKLGARFILSGSDHSFLMAGASARSKFLRGLA